MKIGFRICGGGRRRTSTSIRIRSTGKINRTSIRIRGTGKINCIRIRSTGKINNILRITFYVVIKMISNVIMVT